MSTEYARETAAFDATIPVSNTADSVNDILLDQLKPRLPGSGTISVLAASDVPTAVPTADVSTNTNERDVVGNKTDAAVTAVAATKSAIAYLKGLMGFHTVAVADAVTNAQMRDPIGNKTDAAQTTIAVDKSIMAYAKGLITNVAAIKTPVSLTSGTTAGVIVEDGTTGTPNITTVVSHANANTFGAWTQLDAAASADSWICSMSINHEYSTANILYCLEIGTGGAGAEATKSRWSFIVFYTSEVGQQQPKIFTIPIPIKIASGTRIAAKVSCNIAGGWQTWVSIQMYQSLET